MANNLTLKIMANLAAKEGFETPDKVVKNVAAPVQHLDEREESLLLDLIGEERKPVEKNRVKKQTGVAARAMTLTELADKMRVDRKGS